MEFDMSPAHLKLLFVSSRIEYERKNFRVLLEAIGYLQEPGIQITAVGEVPPVLRQMYPEVAFIGPEFHPKRLRQLYSAVDALVVTSLADTSSNTVKEAYFSGTPVIAADVGGVSELVAVGETGWLFDPYSPRELVALLSRLYSDRSALEGMRKACVAEALAYHTVDLQTQRYLALFNACVGARE